MLFNEGPFWNLRGNANIGTQLALWNFCAKQKLDVLFILETMFHASMLLARFWSLCELKFIATNDRGNLVPNIFPFLVKILMLISYLVLHNKSL